MPSTLKAISPLDGRYAKETARLASYFSEFGFFKYRARAEIDWLLRLSVAPANILEISPSTTFLMSDIIASFSEADAERIKEIEATTDHDIKAVEYWLGERLTAVPEKNQMIPYVHFGATSEDVNSVTHALAVKEGCEEVLYPALLKIEMALVKMARDYAALPMLARTHGQPATPTTLGKEIAVFVKRLRAAREHAMRLQPQAKWGGATGTRGAVKAAFPDKDWRRISKDFICKGLGLEFNGCTTQIEPHDCLVHIFNAFALINTILIDLCRDIWQYVSLGYFRQKLKEGAVGSSTMPHKINPIRFENAEGNLGLANALLGHFSAKLPISRLQRDLSDSTVLRNMGVAFGHGLVAYDSILRGLGRLEVDTVRLARDLDDNWEVLAEPIQTVMRAHGILDAYERLKDLTQGKGINRVTLHEFITALTEIPGDERLKLLELTPATYIGDAEAIALEV